MAEQTSPAKILASVGLAQKSQSRVTSCNQTDRQPTTWHVLFNLRLPAYWWRSRKSLLLDLMHFGHDLVGACDSILLKGSDDGSFGVSMPAIPQVNTYCHCATIGLRSAI